MTSEKTSRSRLRGHILVAVSGLPIGFALTWWAHARTDVTARVWAVALVAGLVLVLLLLGPKAVKH